VQCHKEIKRRIALARQKAVVLARIGPGKRVNGKVAKLKLQYFGHITRGSAGQLALTVLEGIMEGLQHQGRPRDSGYTTLKSGLAANTFS